MTSPTVRTTCARTRTGPSVVLVAAALLLALLVFLAACAPRPPSATLRLEADGVGTIRVDGVEVVLPYRRDLVPGGVVTLAALPGEGQRFVGWAGDVTGQQTPVDLALPVDRTVRAVFEPIPARVALIGSVSGPASGRLVSDPPGLDCDNLCLAYYEAGTTVTLTAVPDPDAFVLAWGGCDAVAAEPVPATTCTVTVTANRAVAVAFASITAPPPNDDFEDRLGMWGPAGGANASNFSATREPDEPLHAPAAAGRTLWWTWPAPATGPATITVTGAVGVEPVVAVYTGASPAEMVRVGSAHSAPTRVEAPGRLAGAPASTTVAFDAVGDTAYHVAVDDVGASGGVLRLTWASEGAVAWRLAPGTLSFDADRGGDPPAPRALTLTHDGTLPSTFVLESSADWLVVTPDAGSLDPAASVDLSVTLLACDDAASEAAAVTVRGGGATATVEVARTCRGADWQATPSDLTFFGEIGGAPPAPRPITLRHTGNTAATFTTAVGAPWLLVAASADSLAPGAETELVVSVAACAGVATDAAPVTVSGGGHALVVEVVRVCREDVPVELRVDRVHVNQAVPAQDPTSSTAVPLVAGRDGLLRAFVTADAPGATGAVVELVHRLPGQPERILRLAGPDAVPTQASEGDRTAVYEATIGATTVGPGWEAYLTATAVDDGTTVAARYPASGWWRPTIRVPAPLAVTLVPIALNGASAPTIADPHAYLDLTDRVFPLAAGTTVDVRAPVAFTGDLRNPADWDRLLRELIRVRVADGSPRHYVGLVNPLHTTGPAGIARIGSPGPAGFVPVAVARWRLPAGNWIVAHELGHTWGRSHAPCGDAPDLDPGFPYPGGRIGVWGYDLVADQLRSPAVATDLMSYCVPDAWISDYTYAGVAAYRHLATPAAAVATAEAPARQRLFLVGGTIDHAGAVTLDPITLLEGVPLPTTPGPYTLVGWDTDGHERVRLPFAAFDVSTHHTEAFVLTVPMDSSVRLAVFHIEFDGVVVAKADIARPN